MFEPTLVIAAAALVGLAIVAATLLQVWHGWLELQRGRIETGSLAEREGSPLGAARIELADLKERIRKLEAIASGVEL